MWLNYWKYFSIEMRYFTTRLEILLLTYRNLRNLIVYNTELNIFINYLLNKRDIILKIVCNDVWWNLLTYVEIVKCLPAIRTSDRNSKMFSSKSHCFWLFSKTIVWNSNYLLIKPLNEVQKFLPLAQTLCSRSVSSSISSRSDRCRNSRTIFKKK